MAQPYPARQVFTMLSGDRGLGKSFLTLDIAARVSNGVPFPDQQEHCEVGNTISAKRAKVHAEVLPAAAPAEPTPETPAEAPADATAAEPAPAPQAKASKAKKAKTPKAPKERKVGGLTACAQIWPRPRSR